MPIGLPLLFSLFVWLSVPDEHQIHWQRSVGDAIAIAKAEGRPILVAVNMDGESASERIVRENYRDPKFVAATRSAVCLVASAFRHTPRDHDDEGRRIPCPRLGEITCGEHIALEPVTYDRWLGGERIAPRHAWLLPDGTKEFDLSLLFDLHELDQRLIAAAKSAPPPHAPARLPESYAELAAIHDHRARLALEERLATIEDEKMVALALVALQNTGDAGSGEALRVLLARSAGWSDDLLAQWAETARKLEAGGGAIVRERLTGLGRHPGATGLGREARLLSLLATLESTPAARSLVIGYLAAGDATDREAASAALERSLGAEPAARTDAELAREGAPIDLRETLLAAGKVKAQPPDPKPVLRPAEELEREMEDLDRAIDAAPKDGALRARYGRASLELAQVRMEEGGSGAQLLLEDAARFLDQAIAARGDDRERLDLLLARARAAFLLARFEDQERAALEALRIAAGHAEDAAWARPALEARRWVGDAAARLLATRSGGDPAVEAAGTRRATLNLLAAAADARSDETDWRSLTSAFGALGMRREELACAQAAALRLPASAALRQALNDALWIGGRIDLAPAKAEWIAAQHPGDAACLWFAGYAHLLQAEELRREEEPDRAIEAYHAAERRFEESRRAEPSFASSADHYRALAALGRGFAHLLENRRREAADALVQAIAIEPAVITARDGLDRDALDLCDGALEWREDGPSPVDPLVLADALIGAHPGDAFWARAVSDSELREALRADGRATEKRTREVVRDGAVVKEHVPVPTAEGDRYLRVSIEVARRAPKIEDTPENRRPLAQSLTILGERLLERGEVDPAREPLREAALLLGQRAPEDAAALETLREVAAELRRELGEARPVFRPGR